MASSKGLGTKLLPITHVNGVKGLLSKLIQSVLMSIPLEMDTMQTLQLNSPHILLGKNIQRVWWGTRLGRGGGCPLSARLFESRGQIHLIEFTRQD